MARYVVLQLLIIDAVVNVVNMYQCGSGGGRKACFSYMSSG